MVSHSEMEIKSYTKNIFVWIVTVVIVAKSYLYYKYVYSLDITRKFKSDMKSVKLYETSISYIGNRTKIFKECFNVPTNSLIMSAFVERMAFRKSNQSKCKRLITLDKYRGRTGNQMFEIASLFGIAYTYDLFPIIPQGTILNKYFDLPNIYGNISSTLHHASNYVCRTWAKVCNFSKQMKTEKGNVTLSGYFQSWKYFNNIRNIIKLLFKFKDIHLKNAKDYLSSVSIKNFHRVCFHIRLLPKYSKGYVLPDETFFEKAKRFYLNHFKFVQFIIISSNKQWCREHFHNVNISHFTNPGDDLALLSICDHVVVTSGTFGWWGAWLSGGTTVYFDRLLQEGSQVKLNMKKEDYYPPSWIGIR